ncbi:hypothetical protein FGU46_10370 [Methanobacterium sp. CWC-01]|uniref:hypothetical protein n=1 Tax=Methanobacterium aridiramus TaxID=2584467 RepID=UPI002578EE90|nr:hypothetical protein [Methanobacterium sp. CWC-01]WJI10464.1 hypothetical protein FGU46_10370 [Methanobacterium sp. CWC-01]
MVDWVPRTHEDKLIYEYWKKKGGLFFLEVTIGSQSGYGNWPQGSGVRRIDAIRIENSDNDILSSKNYRYKDFYNITKGKTVELIEAKQKLNRLVIGQIIAGHDMFQCEYNVNEIKDVILCFKGDPALEWICKNRDIKVDILNGEIEQKIENKDQSTLKLP